MGHIHKPQQELDPSWRSLSTGPQLPPTPRKHPQASPSLPVDAGEHAMDHPSQDPTESQTQLGWVTLRQWKYWSPLILIHPTVLLA